MRNTKKCVLIVPKACLDLLPNFVAREIDELIGVEAIVPNGVQHLTTIHKRTVQRRKRIARSLFLSYCYYFPIAA
jgi:hypothetical protein